MKRLSPILLLLVLPFFLSSCFFGGGSAITEISYEEPTPGSSNTFIPRPTLKDSLRYSVSYSMQRTSVTYLPEDRNSYYGDLNFSLIHWVADGFTVGLTAGVGYGEYTFGHRSVERSTRSYYNLHSAIDIGLGQMVLMDKISFTPIYSRIGIHTTQGAYRQYMPTYVRDFSAEDTLLTDNQRGALGTIAFGTQVNYEIYTDLSIAYNLETRFYGRAFTGGFYLDSRFAVEYKRMGLFLVWSHQIDVNKDPIPLQLGGYYAF